MKNVLLLLNIGILPASNDRIRKHGISTWLVTRIRLRGRAENQLRYQDSVQVRGHVMCVYVINRGSLESLHAYIPA